MSAPTYTVSIICHNHLGMTRRCLDSVLAHSPAETEVIVTDNGSTDATRGHLMRTREKDARLRIVSNGMNLGVMVPKSHALTMARAPWFASLDNDCTVGPGWLQALQRPMDADPQVAQVGRREGFCTLGKTGVGHRGKRLDYIDGSCFLVRTQAARSLGLCDPAFTFAYCEDSDFSLRLRKAGHCIALADADVRHREHATAHGGGLELRAYWNHNHKLLLKRWRGYIRTGEFGHPGEP